MTADATGAAEARQWYYPFGGPRANVNNLPTDRRFTGQRSEEATLGSLYDFVARPYSATLGRFLAPDSIVPEPGNPQSLNRYTYVLNQPLRFTDPTGHAQISDDAGGWGGAIGLAAGYALSVRLDAWIAQAAATVKSSLLLAWVISQFSMHSRPMRGLTRVDRAATLQVLIH